MGLRLGLVAALALIAGCAGEAPAFSPSPSPPPARPVPQSPAVSPSPTAELSTDYRRYRRPYGEFREKDGRFLLVVPLEEAGSG